MANVHFLVPISSWSQFHFVTCSQFQLVVCLYELIVTFPSSSFVHTFAPRKRHLRCCIHTVTSHGRRKKFLLPIGAESENWSKVIPSSHLNLLKTLVDRARTCSSSIACRKADRVDANKSGPRPHTEPTPCVVLR